MRCLSCCQRLIPSATGRTSAHHVVMFLCCCCCCCYCCVFACEGVYVMVSMAVSTVSVIESIIVIRLCTLNTNGTPLPAAVRLVAFRVVGRVLCVSCPSTKVRPRGRCRSRLGSSMYSGDQCSPRCPGGREGWPG